MMTQPFVVLHYPGGGVLFGDPAYRPAITLALTVDWSGLPNYWSLKIGELPRLVWPALALFAFLAWKAAWAVVERRQDRQATHR